MSEAGARFLTMDAEHVQAKLQLSADEDFVLTAWQYRMLQRDVAVSKGKALRLKRAVRDEFRSAAVQALGQRGAAEFSPSIADLFRQLDPTSAAPNLEALEDAGPAAASAISRRSRALLLLIDLYGFEPWGNGKWDKAARNAALAEAHEAIDRLRPEDLDAVSAAYTTALKTLAGPGSWKKYALLAGAGLGLGVLTGGLAAPAIAGAYGTIILGYSGAVATSAGMAALGGGSVAAGGLGMAGGAALISGLTGAVGAGAATLGGKVSGFVVPRVAADAVRLHVVTQLVLRDVEGDEDAAKAVIVSLRERVTNLGAAFATLTERYDEVKAQLEAKRQEVELERARRLEAESKLARFEAFGEKLKERISGPDDAELASLTNELDLLANERTATLALADGVSALADNLEAVA